MNMKSPAQKTKSVVIIEDQTAIRELVTEMLEGKGNSLTTVILALSMGMAAALGAAKLALDRYDPVQTTPAPPLQLVVQILNGRSDATGDATLALPGGVSVAVEHRSE